LKSGAWVNMVQLAVKLVGFALALPLALSAVGGWSAVRGMPVPSADYWNFWSGGASGIVYLAMLGPAFIVSPGLLQKLYGARDDRAVRRGVGFNAVGLVIYAIVPVVLGMIAHVKFPQLATPDLALPMILMHGLPTAIGALGLAAVFSAELSAADAALFMITTSLSQDLYKRFIAPAADERRVLLVARLTTIVAGAVGTALAIVSPTVIDVLSIFYTLLGVSLFVPILGGLYVERSTTHEAAAAIAAGVGGMLIAHILTGGRGYAHLTPALIGLVAAMIGFLVVLATRTGRPASATART
jgi:SSS family solute:Na+ symporter